ncbi:MAG TPA: TlpA disulfide reductase family protein [Candidatus Competibacteraceae bacterium]|nr:TlpA disulfide reductase family protein [Candidatus Competibacteraceae bacterium]
MSRRIFLQRLGGLGLAALPVVGARAAGAMSATRQIAWHETPKPLPEIRFQDGEGRARSLADFRGKVVVLNVWATWCAPCRKEMPSLDRLQQTLGGERFEVVALSIDQGGPAVVRAFFEEVGIHNLAMYIDLTAEVTDALGIFGLPTTLIMAPNSQEIGRLIGPAEWDSPAIVERLRAIMTSSEGTNP